MSQAGILTNGTAIIPTDVPTSFVTDSGIAIPVAHILNVLGTTAAAGTTPLVTSGAGNTVTITAQRSQAVAAPDATRVGLANFDSTDFTVDANGFVSLAVSPIGVIKGPNVDLLTLGNTSLFLFPAKFVLTGLIFTGTSIAGGAVNSDYVMNFGWTAAAFGDVITGFSQGGPSLTDYESGVFLPAIINNFSTIPAGQTLTARVTTADTGTATTYSVRIDMMGYYY